MVSCDVLPLTSSVKAGVVRGPHQTSIQERRFAAVVARCCPLASLVIVLGLSLYSIVFESNLTILLLLASSLNSLMWFCFTAYGMLALLGCFWIGRDLEKSRDAETKSVDDTNLLGDCSVSAEVTHLVIIANFEETELCLEQTLRALAEANGSELFLVVLAMEEREGPSAQAKAASLAATVGKHFAKFCCSLHPPNSIRKHADGTADEEVIGKGSNLAWAIKQAHDEIAHDSAHDVRRVILTVCDADALFHPSYFTRVGKEFLALSSGGADGEFCSMWQAPQFAFRNMYDSPMPSRVWGYIASTYELGGVTALCLGGRHMTFSSFSLSLHLAVSGELWDGDVIAEDHHAFLKGYFYVAHKSLQKDGSACSPPRQSTLTVRPVMLPVKSLSLQCAGEPSECKGWCKGWLERFHQARRHQHGIAEMSYSVLCVYEFLKKYPCKATWQLVTVLILPFNCYILPNIQTIALLMISIFWVYKGGEIPVCSSQSLTHVMQLVCGAAGAWTLIWPICIPFVLMGLANICLILTFFVQPAVHEAARGTSRAWFVESGVGSAKGCWCPKCVIIGLVIVDLLFGLPLVAVYGFLPGIAACFSICLTGNRFLAKKAPKGST